jgi:hypothetical protein
MQTPETVVFACKTKLVGILFTDVAKVALMIHNSYKQGILTPLEPLLLLDPRTGPIRFRMDPESDPEPPELSPDSSPLPSALAPCHKRFSNSLL